jgi:hypothetical protein
MSHIQLKNKKLCKNSTKKVEVHETRSPSPQTRSGSVPRMRQSPNPIGDWWRGLIAARSGIIKRG